MDKFDEFEFRIDNLISFYIILNDFISTFVYYNVKNKCKDDGNKYLKMNKKLLLYVIKSIIFCIKMTQTRLRSTLKSIYFIIMTFYLRINGNIVVFSFVVMVIQKAMVRDIAHNRKSKPARTINPTPFDSIFYEDCSPNIISYISEGFRVEKMPPITRTLFSDKKKM